MRWRIDLGQGSNLVLGLVVLGGVVLGLGLLGTGLLAGQAVPSGLLAGLAGGTVALIALIRAGRLQTQMEKLSGDLDAVSSQLLAIRAGAPMKAAPDPSAELAEVTGELALLGGLVRDLAVTVAAHDRALAHAPAAPEVRVPEPARFEPRAAEAKAAEAARPVPRPDPVPARPAPVPAPRPRDEPASGVTDTRRLAAILEAFKADQIELHLQPIVSLPQRKTKLYEALARLRLPDGDRLVPAEFLAVLERAGLAPALDRKVLARSAAIARHLASRGSEAAICCNLSPVSVAEPGFLRALGRLLDGYPDLASRLVLELSQTCWRSLDAERAGALAALRDQGLAFALDRASDPRLDPATLADRGLRYLKLPAELLLRPNTGRGADIAAGDLAAVLARAGINLVAERVEREEDVLDLIDLDVPLAQGLALAPPRAVRADVLAPSGPAPQPETAPEPAPAEPEPTPQRVPFRTFLRRAG